MRRVIFFVIGLLALFVILRAYTEDGGETGETRFLIHPGTVEFESSGSSVQIAFGLLDRSGNKNRLWNIFPVRISVSSGDKKFSIGLNGLSFITRSGVCLGKPITIKGTKYGDVISIGGDVTIGGTVDGDVWSIGSDIVLLSNAVITGDVVALGGTIEADRKSHIKGNKHALPSVKVPFIGLLTSDHSADTFRFIIAMLGIILYLFILFVFIHFAHQYLSGLTGVLSAHWKGTILYLALFLLILPLIVLLLVTSIIGIILIPFLFGLLIVIIYIGFVSASVRVGLWLRRKQEGDSALYISGLLGLLVIRGPVLLGILLSLLTSDLFRGIGRFLVILGTVITTAACLYGLGGVILFFRVKAKS